MRLWVRNRNAHRYHFFVLRSWTALFTALGDKYLLGFAKKHHDVIERFGRFPHRNAILGRAPRADEIAAGDVVPW